MKSLCVFLGATIPKNPKFLEATLALGKILAERKVHLVYGGAKVGLMGQLADAVLANGGSVVGVMATVLEGEKNSEIGRLYERDRLTKSLCT